MKQEKDIGFVLRHTSMSESRLILDILSRDVGKLQGMLRLSRKESRSFLTPLTRIAFCHSGKQQQSIKRITELSVEDHCYNLAADYPGLLLVTHWSRLLAITQPDALADAHVFRLMDHLLPALDRLRPSPAVLNCVNLYFEIWLLHFCGVLGRELAPPEGPVSELEPEERLFRKLDPDLLAIAFQRKIEDYLPLALQLGTLNRSSSVLGTLWERFLGRELKTRRLFYQELLKVRGS